jgi:hypothetical protein
VPIRVYLYLLSWQFDEVNVSLFNHALTSSFFRFNGQFYVQMDGATMGSPLSLLIATFFMEDFEELALIRATYKPTCWFCYVDGIFVIWRHGPKELNEWLNHLNNIHPNVQFTIETETNDHLPFLDTDVFRRPDDTLMHTVCRNPTHTNLYLNANYHHHPANNHTVPSTVVHRARVICDRERLQGEFEFFRGTFRENGYSDEQIRRVNSPRTEDIPREDLKSMSFLTYVGRRYT